MCVLLTPQDVEQRKNNNKKRRTTVTKEHHHLAYMAFVLLRISEQSRGEVRRNKHFHPTSERERRQKNVHMNSNENVLLTSLPKANRYWRPLSSRYLHKINELHCQFFFHNSEWSVIQTTTNDKILWWLIVVSKSVTLHICVTNMINISNISNIILNFQSII